MHPKLETEGRLIGRVRRLEIARRRIVSVLKTHGIATARTLEQKIADAGPFWMRIHPHLLTEARRNLEQTGRVIRLARTGNTPWFHLDDTRPAVVKRRLALQEPIHQATLERDFLLRLGQTLEIATYRALLAQSKFEYLGGFADLDKHGDDQLYSKTEPPGQLSGRNIGARRHDFMVIHSQAGLAGIEVKNIRDWMYPDREEVKSPYLEEYCSEYSPGTYSAANSLRQFQIDVSMRYCHAPNLQSAISVS